jgi:hypothetical protein
VENINSFGSAATRRIFHAGGCAKRKMRKEMNVTRDAMTKIVVKLIFPLRGATLLQPIDEPTFNRRIVLLSLFFHESGLYPVFSSALTQTSTKNRDSRTKSTIKVVVYCLL